MQRQRLGQFFQIMGQQSIRQFVRARVLKGPGERQMMHIQAGVVIVDPGIGLMIEDIFQTEYLAQEDLYPEFSVEKK